MDSPSTPLSSKPLSGDLKADMVNHPPHYNKGQFETIAVIEDIAKSYSGYHGYLAGCVIKYISRAPFKGNSKQDLQKAQWYMNKLVESAS